ncbi:NAD(+) salvage pathway protein [Aspergillus alliaceus]|uniref:nicotinamidase n=1 Tax=Petromyces alliaceus TaxID=209559 RepID=A0A5N7CEZ7_PETAA|nr:Isochorismatase-like protein [Aspergillus alliaceus]KAB8235071.1 Isochorismatase-like protein [Aspergillus alliaceus]KAE8392746.1 Isochorismatase-like protein [Aspergillus alliaceus]KAF5865726.1 NAD(+) salvage pathway protein [Aspergillus burnettii]
MKAALLVVDIQEDFCPPNGSLAVQEGRSVAPIVNSLLVHPGFAIRVATQDYHPENHISFANSHPAPNNIPLESVITVNNPAPGKGSETRPQRLWPAHCVGGTAGAEIIPEINTSNIDVYVRKGMHPQAEMYSAFADAFGNIDPSITVHSVNVDLKSLLVSQGITDVFVTGLAGDYCVKHTAIDATKVGFKSYVVEDATRCVVPGSGWDEAEQEMRKTGVSIIRSDGPEIAGLKV